MKNVETKTMEEIQCEILRYRGRWRDTERDVWIELDVKIKSDAEKYGEMWRYTVNVEIMKK